MARIKLKTSSGNRAVSAGLGVNPDPRVSPQSFFKLSAATATLTGAAMTPRMTMKAKKTASGMSEPKSKPKSKPYDGPCKIRTVCTSCAVGCGIEAEVHNGVWIRQHIAADHPVSAGGHCYRGAGAIDMVSSTRRLKNPMKKVNGRWINITWDQAIGEIGDKLLALRGQDGPDVLQFLGSAKVSTEMAYLQRKFAAFWGSNNIDHQGRF